MGRLVEIRGVELLEANFWRTDDQALPSASAGSDAVPEFGVQPRWELSEDHGTLGCTIGFATLFPGESEGERAPYSLVARFRLLYSLPTDHDLADDEIENFVHWNAVFNAWPYWREYLSSTINRANLPRLVAPVMKLPLNEVHPDEPEGSPE